MDKKVLVGIIAAVILLIAGGAFFFFSSRSAPSEEEEGFAEEILPEISPEELGLEIIPSDDMKYIQFKLTELDGITHLEWEFTYDAVAPDTGDGGGGLVTQGFGGEADISSGESEFVSEKRELGTCSTGGACRFDTGIEKIDLILKVTKSDGKVYQAETSKTL